MTTQETQYVNALVRKAQGGDSMAFGKIYDNFAQRIFKYIRLKIQNREEAEDVLQEVFIKAYKGLKKLSLVDLNFSAWLYRIASNTINDRFRKKYRTPEISSIEEGMDVPANVSLKKEMEVKSDWETVRKAFRFLPPLYKQVLELRFLQDYSSDEVAKILHKSNLAVRLLQYRALKKVQGILKASYDLEFAKFAL